MEVFNSVEKPLQKHTPNIVNIFRAGLCSVLLLSSLSAFAQSSKQTGTYGLQDRAGVYDKKITNKEGYEVYEDMFKHSLKNNLNALTSLYDIPKGGWNIVYDECMDTDIYAKHYFPKTFDIFPKTISTPVSSLTIVLGERKFKIIPNVGKIKSIEMDESSLKIETTLFIKMEYSKEEKLTYLLWKLLNTPVGPGEKSGFVGVTVVEY